ncbi:MAG: cupin domain-containing protein [Acidobacteriota bacterium]|nr:cupin domain-containing protein [Acidobacteriota bacterium]
MSDSTQISDSGGFSRPADSVERRVVAAGISTDIQVLLEPAGGAPRFSMRRFTIGPGGGMPRHTNMVEHGQYVLHGRARVGIGDQVHYVGPDDVLYIPAGVPHFYEVVDAPFQFLCVVPDSPDRIEFLAAASDG